jgi:hypothetical protein
MLSWIKSIFWSKKEVKERRTSIAEMSESDRNIEKMVDNNVV